MNRKNNLQPLHIFRPIAKILQYFAVLDIIYSNTHWELNNFSIEMFFNWNIKKYWNTVESSTRPLNSHCCSENYTKTKKTKTIFIKI